MAMTISSILRNPFGTDPPAWLRPFGPEHPEIHQRAPLISGSSSKADYRSRAYDWSEFPAATSVLPTGAVNNPRPPVFHLSHPFDVEPNREARAGRQREDEIDDVDEREKFRRPELQPVAWSVTRRCEALLKDHIGEDSEEVVDPDKAPPASVQPGQEKHRRFHITAIQRPCRNDGSESDLSRNAPARHAYKQHVKQHRQKKRRKASGNRFLSDGTVKVR
jgi:hypothetical protein